MKIKIYKNNGEHHVDYSVLIEITKKSSSNNNNDKGNDYDDVFHVIVYCDVMQTKLWQSYLQTKEWGDGLGWRTKPRERDKAERHEVSPSAKRDRSPSAVWRQTAKRALLKMLTQEWQTKYF